MQKVPAPKIKKYEQGKFIDVDGVAWRQQGPALISEHGKVFQFPTIGKCTKNKKPKNKQDGKM